MFLFIYLGIYFWVPAATRYQPSFDTVSSRRSNNFEENDLANDCAREPGRIESFFRDNAFFVVADLSLTFDRPRDVLSGFRFVESFGNETC